MALFSSEDILPGLIGNRIPYNPFSVQYKMNMGNRRNLYIYRLRLQLLGIDEKALTESLSLRARNKFEIPKNEEIEAKICERKLIVFGHNSWKVITKAQSFNL